MVDVHSIGKNCLAGCPRHEAVSISHRALFLDWNQIVGMAWSTFTAVSASWLISGHTCARLRFLCIYIYI